MAKNTERKPFNNPVIDWVDQRLPLFTMLDKEYGRFPTPKNFNYFWNFGAIAMFMLVTMILSGIFLAMNYAANTHIAFDSVERIMRDVNWGWFMRYLHANGASMFFIAVYIHIFRGMYYGSYKQPRELLWILGVVIFLLMMATAFMGYVLPWGQMSFWGATVITNLFSAFPLVGEHIVTWLWGGFSVDNPTLNRFFALHYLLPFVIFAVVFLHVWALHVTGSNNPLGIEPQSEKDTIPFHPYYTMKDGFGLVMFMIFYAAFVFFAPNVLGHPDNYIAANPMQTPPHIVPEWYFLPFYAILRAMPDVALPVPHVGIMVLAGLAVIAIAVVTALCCILPKLRFAAVNWVMSRPTYMKVASSIVTFFAIWYGMAVAAGIVGMLFFGTSMTFYTLVSAKLVGVLAMFGAIAIWFVLPWLDCSPVRSAVFRPWYRKSMMVLVVAFLLLGCAGYNPPDGTVNLFGMLETHIPWLIVAQLASIYYFAHFLVLLPLFGRFEPRPMLPPSIHQAVLANCSNNSCGCGG